MSNRIKLFLRNNNYFGQTYIKVTDKYKRFYFQKKGLKVVKEVISILNSNNIIAFPDFGTLLGLIREKKLLDNDLDVDIGISPSTDIPIESIKGIMEQNGYKICREFTVLGIVKEQSYKKGRIKCDLQYYYIKEDPRYMWCSLFYNGPAYKKIEEPTNGNKEFIKRKIYQMNSVEKKCPIVEKLVPWRIKHSIYYVPENYEQLLEFKYGVQWKQPDKGWRYWEGPNTYNTSQIGIQTWWII